MFKVKNLKNAELRRLMKKIHACEESFIFVDDKDLKQALAACGNLSWITWFIQEINDFGYREKLNFPTVGDYVLARMMNWKDTGHSPHLATTRYYDEYLAVAKSLFSFED